MRRLITILFCSCFGIIPIAKAQTFYSAYEFGFSAGLSQYFGDLNDNYGFKFIRPLYGAFGRYHLNPYISLRASANMTHVGYDDKFNDNLYQKTRNLNFESDIFEVMGQAEFNFFRYATGELHSRFTPYLTGGIGLFYYNPYTYFQGNKYNLRDIGTEGQNIGRKGNQYGSIAVCFPIGAGFKWWALPGVNIGLELSDRLTTTDYMDDVSSTYVGSDKFPNDPSGVNAAYYLQDRSLELNPTQALGRAGKQRGNTSTFDQYLVLQLNVSFQIKVYRCPGYLKKDYLY